MGVLQVPFGKVVRCPSCAIAVGVAQPQQGIQVLMNKTSSHSKIGSSYKAKVMHAINAVQYAPKWECGLENLLALLE